MSAKQRIDQVDQGIGVGYRPSFREAFLGGPARACVSWIEVITENYFPGPEGLETRARQTLRALRRDFPVALHGIGLNIGSAEPLEERYLSHLSSLAAEIDPWIVSDHLCWTGLRGENLFDLLPLPLNEESLSLVADKVQRVQDRLRRPLMLENISFYAAPAPSGLPEESFLNELAARTGCRLLLDINNLYVNGKNLGVDPLLYLSRLNLSHVAQAHLAGHAERPDGLLIDTHGAPLREEVWELYRAMLALAGPVPTMIERDQNIPPWPEMETELKRLRELRAPFLRKEHHHERIASPVADARP